MQESKEIQKPHLQGHHFIRWRKFFHMPAKTKVACYHLVNPITSGVVLSAYLLVVK